MNRFWINVNIIIYDSSCKIYTSSTTFSILFFKNIDYIWYLKPCSYHFWYGSLSLIVSHFQKKAKKHWLIIYISKTWKTLPGWSRPSWFMPTYTLTTWALENIPLFGKGNRKGVDHWRIQEGEGTQSGRGELCGPGHPWIRKYFVSCTVLNQQIKHIIKAIVFTAFGTSMATFGVVLVTSR